MLTTVEFPASIASSANHAKLVCASDERPTMRLPCNPCRRAHSSGNLQTACMPRTAPVSKLLHKANARYPPGLDIAKMPLADKTTTTMPPAGIAAPPPRVFHWNQRQISPSLNSRAFVVCRDGASTRATFRSVASVAADESKIDEVVGRRWSRTLAEQIEVPPSIFNFPPVRDRATSTRSTGRLPARPRFPIRRCFYFWSPRRPPYPHTAKSARSLAAELAVPRAKFQCQPVACVWHPVVSIGLVLELSPARASLDCTLAISSIQGWRYVGSGIGAARN